MVNKERNGNRAHLEIIQFEADPSPEGFMVSPGAPPTELPVERNAENDHLFMYNRTAERFEVLRYGSGIIVDLLRLYEKPAERPNGATPLALERKLTVFDTSGNCYYQALLEDLRPKDYGGRIDPDVRHTATFMTPDEEISLTIDNIRVFGLAKPAQA